MSNLTTYHNGHEVSYNENDDVWTCKALSLRGKSLGALKKKITEHDSMERRLGDKGVKCLMLSRYSWRGEKLSEATATMLDQNGSAVWVKGGGDGKDRQKERRA